MKRTDRPLRGHSDTHLQAMVARLERALFAGTSSHRDVGALVEAEREIRYREQKRLRATVSEERRARSQSAEAGWLSLAPAVKEPEPKRGDVPA